MTEKDATDRSMAILDITENGDSFEPLSLSRPRKLIYEECDLNELFVGCKTNESKKEKFIEFIDQVLSPFEVEGEEPDKSSIPLVKINVKSSGIDVNALGLKLVSSHYQDRVANYNTMFKFSQKVSHTKPQKEKIDDDDDYKISVDDHVEVEDLLREKIKQGTFDFVSNNVINDSLRDYIKFSNTKELNTSIEGMFKQRLEFIVNEFRKKSAELDSAFSLETAESFIKEHTSQLPEPVRERIAQEDGPKKTSALSSPSKPVDRSESVIVPDDGDEEEKYVIPPPTARSRPKRKTSKI